MTHVYTDAAEKSHGKSKTPATPQQARNAPAPAAAGPKDRDHRIAEAAYFHAEHRGFVPGHELQDWLAAEAELGLPALKTAPEAESQIAPGRFDARA